jgi:hypothetical protein
MYMGALGCFKRKFVHYTNRSSTITLWIYDIDMIISIEISDKDINLKLFHIFTLVMIYCSCGTQNQKSPCMQSDKCIKYFPKKYGDHTIIDQDEYPIYIRSDN